MKNDYINGVKKALNWQTAEEDVGDVNAGHTEEHKEEQPKEQPKEQPVVDAGHIEEEPVAINAGPGKIPEEHKKKHSKKHVGVMKKEMRKGNPFKKAHKTAMKTVGAGKKRRQQMMERLKKMKNNRNNRNKSAPKVNAGVSTEQDVKEFAKQRGKTKKPEENNNNNNNNNNEENINMTVNAGVSAGHKPGHKAQIEAPVKERQSGPGLQAR